MASDSDWRAPWARWAISAPDWLDAGHPEVDRSCAGKAFPPRLPWSAHVQGRKSQTEPEEGLWRLSHWQLQINPDPGLSRIHPSHPSEFIFHHPPPSSSLTVFFPPSLPIPKSSIASCVVLALFHLVQEIHSPPFIRAIPLSEAPLVRAENWPPALPASCHCCRSSRTPKKKIVFFRPSTFFLTQQTLQLTPPSCPSPALFRT